ncbi:unnamed protein product, partial [Chrysoparadoxa australica]
MIKGALEKRERVKAQVNEATKALVSTRVQGALPGDPNMLEVLFKMAANKWQVSARRKVTGKALAKI